MRGRLGTKGYYRCIMTLVSCMIVCLLLQRVAAGLVGLLLLLPVIFLSAGFVILFSILGGKGRALVGMAILILIITVLLFDQEKRQLSFAEHYLNWLQNGTQWLETELVSYQLCNMIWIAMATAIVSILLERIFYGHGVVSLLLLVYLLFALIGKRQISELLTGLIFLYLLLFIIEWIQKRDRRLVVWTSPFLLLYLILLLLLPVQQERYQWNFVKQIWSGMQEAGMMVSQGMQNMFQLNTEDFALNFAGFSEEGKLGGSVIATDKEVMRIETGKNLKTNIYLDGVVYDTFRDNEWTQSDFMRAEQQGSLGAAEDGKPAAMDTGRRIDLIETAYAVNRYQEAAKSDYIRSTDLTITYRDFYTSYLFAPLKSWNIQMLKGKAGYRSEGDNLLFSKGAGFRTQYYLEFAQLNVDHDRFYEMVETENSEALERSGESAENDDNVRKLVAANKQYFELNTELYVTEEMLQEHRDWIYDCYLPQTKLSDEVQELTDTITASCTTDLERLRALEGYLSSLTYTRTPAVPAQDQNFLDFFLLKSKEGYCTYFATAFVLMARAEGIPARYVQGFCIPVHGGSKEVSVSSAMAHAWPEAYIEGVGWIPFEPTPSYGKVRYTPWAALSDKGKDTGMAGSASGYAPEAEEPEEMQAQDRTRETAEEVLSRQLLGKAVGSAVLLLLAGLSILFATDQMLFRRKYKRMTAKERICHEMRSVLGLLSYFGYHLHGTGYTGGTAGTNFERGESGGICI